jgi:hypothetical protein
MTSQPSVSVLRYGSEAALPEPRDLRAGPLTMTFVENDLRWIRYGDQEVVRRIYVAVRDPNWNTVPLTVSNVNIDARRDSFDIRFDCRHTWDPIDFSWRGTISGSADGVVSFAMAGRAESQFLRNRIGICVLHSGKHAAGAAFATLHDDGTVSHGTLARLIDPHGPTHRIRSFMHEIGRGLYANIDYEGDVFEMEDQRNWTDATFKTFSTPLDLPTPVLLEPGTRVDQRVRLSLKGNPTMQPAWRPDPRAVLGREAVGTLPELGVGSASDGQPLTTAEVERLRALKPGHLRAAIHLSNADHAAALERAVAESTALGVPLELAIYLSSRAEQELAQLRAAIDRLKPSVRRWLVFEDNEVSTTERYIVAARQALGSYDPAAQIVAGSRAYFTQLNRGRPSVGLLDGVCYSVNPQVHQFDNWSMVETLEGQAWTVATARSFCGDKPIVVSPVTLRPRFNANQSTANDTSPSRLPWAVDPRQTSLFGAAWTVGSLKYLTESGVASATYYETAGWRGVQERVGGCAHPELFPSIAGAVFPLYHVLADVGEMRGAEVIPVEQSNPLECAVLAMRKNGVTRLLVANLCNANRTVRVGILVGRARGRILDDTNAIPAMTDPATWRAAKPQPFGIGGGELTVALRPYAVATIDVD